MGKTRKFLEKTLTIAPALYWKPELRRPANDPDRRRAWGLQRFIREITTSLSHLEPSGILWLELTEVYMSSTYAHWIFDQLLKKHSELLRSRRLVLCHGDRSTLLHIGSALEKLGLCAYIKKSTKRWRVLTGVKGLDWPFLRTLQALQTFDTQVTAGQVARFMDNATTTTYSRLHYLAARGLVTTIPVSGREYYFQLTAPGLSKPKILD